ncbi:alpha/beta fold hydrolase [Streptomyces erythrochromogenes]|uniref:alpha/beta fold hydrolase n=1 Tax=Streptomyces erythrochromogenes TaxID=285574 RepID=UPI0037024CB7
MLDMNMCDEQFLWLAGLGYRVIRYDARGHGRSSMVAEEYANHDDLHALLTHLDVPCATLVGHSLGARTAVDAAIAHPESVSALVLASPGVSGRPFADPYVAHHTAQQMAAMADPDGGAQRFVEHFLRMWVDGPYREPSEVGRALRERIHASASAHVMRHARGHRPNRSRRQAPTFRVGSPHGQPRVHGTLQPRGRILPRVHDWLLSTSTCTCTDPARDTRGPGGLRP